MTFPWEFNPRNTRLWVIGNEYGALCAVWADCEQDAFDEAMDHDLLGGLAVEEEDIERDKNGEEMDVMRVGNASEPIDSANAWIEEVPVSGLTERQKIAFAEARGDHAETVEDFAIYMEEE